jgi:hypothetical protein
MYNGVSAGIGMLTFLFMLAMMVLYIYMFVLFVRLANRGIKALDIYISKNSPQGFPGGPMAHNQFYGQQPPPPYRDNNRNEG